MDFAYFFLVTQQNSRICKKKQFRIVGTLKNTSTIMNNTFWIGVYPGLTHQELDFVIDQIKKFVH